MPTRSGTPPLFPAFVAASLSRHLAFVFRGAGLSSLGGVPLAHPLCNDTLRAAPPRPSAAVIPPAPTLSEGICFFFPVLTHHSALTTRHFFLPRRAHSSNLHRDGIYPPRSGHLGPPLSGCNLPTFFQRSRGRALNGAISPCGNPRPNCCVWLFHSQGNEPQLLPAARIRIASRFADEPNCHS